MEYSATSIQPGGSVYALRRGNVLLAGAEAFRIRLLVEIGDAIDAADLDQEALLLGVCQRLADLVGDNCAALLASGDGKFLKVAAAYDPRPEGIELIRSVPFGAVLHSDGQTFSRRVMEGSRPLRITRVDGEQLRSVVRPELLSSLDGFEPRSLMLVPLSIDGKPIGLLHLVRYLPGQLPYDDEEERLVLVVAERTARALSRIRLVADQQARNALLAQEARELHAALQQRLLGQIMAGGDGGTFLERLVAASPFLMWQADADTLTVSYISPNAQDLLGYAPAEIIGAAGFWKARVAADEYDQFRAAVEKASRSPFGRMESEFRIRHRDGTLRWFYTLAGVERDAAGPARSVLAFALDVTARKSAEDALDQARLDAEKANHAKSEFLSRMSHELRTPLNAVLGFAQLLEMDPLSPEQRESLGYILKAGRHLLDLINEVLDIARIEAGRLAISPEAVPLSEAAEEVMALAAPLASDRNISLHSRIADGVHHYVLADRQRLKQILLNLLSNAVKYNRRGGRVVLRHDVLDGRVRILVSDTGPGIPAEKRNRLFIPFERLGTGQGGVEGTGLGLALSRRLTEAMGGAIGVESEVGRGSTFWIELPLAEPPEDQEERAADDLRVPSNSPSSRTYTVLYIEDNLANLELIERLLSRRPGFKLLSAMQGRIGLNLAREHRPDLILLDMRLPDVPGHEILHRLRADFETRLIPVVALISEPTPEETERFLAAGARACLAKPVDVKALMRILDDSLKLRID